MDRGRAWRATEQPWVRAASEPPASHAQSRASHAHSGSRLGWGWAVAPPPQARIFYQLN